MNQSRRILGWIGELGLWGVANTLCVGLATGALYTAHQMFEFKIYFLVPMLIATIIASLTWGSWATLVWTRSRNLRLFQQGVTLVPGVLSIVGAGALFYAMPKSWLAALILGVSGLGMLVSSVMLAGGLLTKNNTPSRLQYIVGLFVYPVITLLASSSVLAVLSTLWGDGPKLTKLVGLPALMILALTITMVTTVIPAGISRGCQQLCGMWAQRQR